MEFRGVKANVEDVDPPDADVVVCSIVLHHIAGTDAEHRRERKLKGPEGPGKAEVLKQIVRALEARRGIGLLNEADTYHDIELDPNHPALIERCIDAYVRRGTSMIIAALEDVNLDEDLRARWEVIMQDGFVGEALATVGRSLERRFNYELDVPRWLSLLRHVGAEVASYQYTDDWHLFVQYVFSPMSAVTDLSGGG